MPPVIKLESLDDPPIEIVQFGSGTLTIGREPENHVVVDSESVSRQHGCIFEADSHWFFRDFQSTNGSWINGVKLPPGQMKLLRHGDVIQLADFPMKIWEVERTEDEIRAQRCSVLVFDHDSFVNEFLLDTPGASFVIGGPHADLMLPASRTDGPELSVTNHGNHMELSCGIISVPVIVNGMASGGVATLKDRDEIVVGTYRLIVNDMRTSTIAIGRNGHQGFASNIAPGRQVQAYDRPNLPEHLQRPKSNEWESEAAKRKQQSGRRFIFGSDSSEDEVTTTIGLKTMELQRPSGFEMSASQRFSRAVFEAEKRSGNSLSDSLVPIFGVIIFFMLVGFLAYFFLFAA